MKKKKSHIRWAIFVSGEGTNLQNVLNLEKKELKKSKIVAVVADRPCRALERAQKAKKDILLFSPRENSAMKKVHSFLMTRKVQRIFLLGYMRVLPASFLKKWEEKIMNLHPSWLPQYPGLYAIERAWRGNTPFLGVTLHEVVQKVDTGPILRQISFPRDPRWSLKQTEIKVHEVEGNLVRDYLLDLEENS